MKVQLIEHQLEGLTFYYLQVDGSIIDVTSTESLEEINTTFENKVIHVTYQGRMRMNNQVIVLKEGVY